MATTEVVEVDPVTGAPVDLLSEIVEALRISPRSVAWLCEKNAHWPSVQTLYNWKAKSPEFRNAFNQARRDLADELAYQTIEIADDGSGDALEVERKDGSSYTILNNEFVQRSKLRTEVRRWLASKLAPETYGERIDVNARVGVILPQEDALDQLR